MPLRDEAIRFSRRCKAALNRRNTAAHSFALLSLDGNDQPKWELVHPKSGTIATPDLQELHALSRELSRLSFQLMSFSTKVHERPTRE